MKATVANRCKSAALLMFLMSCVACNKISYNFSKLSVDSNLHVSKSGVMFSQPVSGEYYFLYHEGKLPSIHHFEKKDANTNPHRLLFLELDPDSILQRTVKHEVLLGGPYGIVYADKLCFYKPTGPNDRNSVSVGTYLNGLEEDVPAVVKAPDTLPPLTSISLVRIFHVGTEYVVVSANYEADGNIGTIHIDHTQSGTWASGETFAIPKDRSDDSLRAAGVQPDLLDSWGIPGHIDIAAVMKDKHIDLPEVKHPEERQVLNQHYGWDKIIRQDELIAGRISATTWLQPPVTSEEETLNPLCDARLAQQQTAGTSTLR